MVKLNQRNPAVKDHICDAIRFWVSEFDVDGIRLDAADVLDFDFMQALRHLANEVKPDFWLMGEVIHGDYSRWVNEGTLHSVTNYQLHKALYSGHNDHNYFEIAHTVKRLYEMGGSKPDGLKLYNFVDNHDVERIYTKLNNKAHFAPVHILMYTLPGIPSIYYGSEFAIEGRKEKWSDASLRPALNLSDFKDAVKTNPATELIAALGHARQKSKALAYGDYRELMLTNRQYAFSRNFESESAIVTVNNDDCDFTMTVAAGNSSTYVGVLSGEKVSVNNGCITVNVKANYGELWLPEEVVSGSSYIAPVKLSAAETPTAAPGTGENPTSEPSPAVQKEAAGTNTQESPSQEAPKAKAPAPITPDGASDNMTDKEKEAFEKGKIAGLQEAILATMEKNGPLTDQMRRDVANNVYHDSLINWIKSFR